MYCYLEVNDFIKHDESSSKSADLESWPVYILQYICNRACKMIAIASEPSSTSLNFLSLIYLIGCLSYRTYKAGHPSSFLVGCASSGCQACLRHWRYSCAGSSHISRPAAVPSPASGCLTGYVAPRLCWHTQLMALQE